jgi:hypothetical protein
MFQKTTFILFLLAIVSCNKTASVEKDKIKTADWLIGNWEKTSPEGVISENWEKVNDSTFSATSYFIKGKDTLHFEKIVLAQKGETLTYNALVKGQNDDKSVAFPSTLDTENQLVFENPTHDYPQKIKYTKGQKNIVVIEISGIQQGKPSAEKFVLGKK